MELFEERRQYYEELAEREKEGEKVSRWVGGERMICMGGGVRKKASWVDG